VSPSGCVHVGHGQQKVCYKCGWDCYVTSTTRETGGGRLLQTFCCCFDFSHTDEYLSELDSPWS
jgi:hypothetical protein